MYRDLIKKYFELFLLEQYKLISNKNSNVYSQNKFFKLLETQATEAKTSLELPARIQWEITGRCNFRCKHCILLPIKD